MRANRKRIKVFLLMLLGGLWAAPSVLLFLLFLLSGIRNGLSVLKGMIVDMRMVVLVACPVLLILALISILFARRLEGHADRIGKRGAVKWLLRISGVVGLLWSVTSFSSIFPIEYERLVRGISSNDPPRQVDEQTEKEYIECLVHIGLLERRDRDNRQRHVTTVCLLAALSFISFIGSFAICKRETAGSHNEKIESIGGVAQAVQGSTSSTDPADSS